jgi:hypothetical protein
VRLEKVGQVGIALLVRAVHDRVVDAEVNLGHFGDVLGGRLLLLNKAHEDFEGKGVAVELAVQHRPGGHLPHIGPNVVQLKERLAVAAVEISLRVG